MDFVERLTGLFLEYGVLAVFLVLVACGLGFPVPEEIVLIGAGLVVYEGRAELLLMQAVTVVGILAGDSIIFLLGRRFGPGLLQRPFFRRILHADRMSKVYRQFERHGVKVVFFARFFAGIRACVYFTSGVLGMRYRTFLLLDLLGALISAPVSVWLGWHFGAEIERCLRYVSSVDRILWLCVGVAALVLGVRSIRRARRESVEARKAGDVASVKKVSIPPVAVTEGGPDATGPTRPL